MSYQLDALKGGAETFAAPFINMFGELASYLPNLFVGFILLVLGLIVSPIIGNAVTRLLSAIKVDEGMDRSGATKALRSVGMKFSLASAIGVFVKYVVLIVFLTLVADALQLAPLSDLIARIILFIPQIVIALVILGVGLTAADFLRDMVVNMSKASDNGDYAGILGSVTRISVIVFAAMAALSQIGIAPVLIQIIFAGVVFALALAFGLGTKDQVARMIENYVHKK